MGGFEASADDAASREHPFWEVGVSFSLPIGNRSAEAIVRQRALEVREADLIIERERRRISIASRAAWRAARRAEERLDRNRARIGIEERRLEAERGRLAAGASTRLDARKAEDRLEEARLEQVRLRAEAAIQRARLLREEGTLGAAWGFWFDLEPAGDR